ncbi:MAG TPA: acetamidase/formamidase family protein [Pseudothermotoga sp.]|nr:acetamidase/formamidase family protein [Pseudothermotoga sp.]HOK83542.1 acetamidase/formamidase family protein [Pseudothermotoga sp.]HPP69615.1 acetamidase/formamidase family protein [Pseudothermotoga sp.]
MKLIKSDNCIYAFSQSMQPVETAEPGEILLFETSDALGGQIKDENDTTNLDFSKVNPATGPVFIKNAHVGQTLKVKILDIEISDRGVIVAEEGFGVLPDAIKGFKAKVLEINNGFICFDNITLSIDPMIGVIGVAPEKGEFPTGTASKHGGNMDTKYIKSGSTLYLPIFQEGALLALGDVHALMADGEVCVSACEVGSKVTIKTELIDRKINWPVVETDQGYFILVSLPDINEAFREATLQSVELLSEQLRIPFEKAYMLASLVVDIQISQLVDPNKTVRAFVPKRIFW